MDRTNLISVIMPTYNSGDYISKTLLSVFSQTLKPFEVIVSDDGSKDNTREEVESIFKKFPSVNTRFLENEHLGPGANRNIGIEAATGNWIAFLDSDDHWLESKLEKVFENINKNSEIDLWCHSEIVDFGNKKGELLYYEKFDSTKEAFLNLYKQNSLSTSAVVVKRTLLTQVGGFDPKLASAQDYDLWLSLAVLGCKVGFIKDILGTYNVREGNISSKPKVRLKCLLEIDKKYLMHLRKTSSFWIFYRLRFNGMAFLSCGFVLVSQRKFVQGVFYVILGMILWPFQKEFYSAVIKKFHL